MEGDLYGGAPLVAADRISIHALRVEGDYLMSRNTAKKHAFLSTPSGWRATYSFRAYQYGVQHFYPRPPGGGRPSNPRFTGGQDRFLSTPSGWRATLINAVPDAFQQHFYPRPPGGGRPRRTHCRYPHQKEFLSTPSGWRATAYSDSGGRLYRISIHALRVEGDQLLLCLFHAVRQFLSTPSGWRATVNAKLGAASTPISIHALRVEGDDRALPSGPGRIHFYPRPPGGGRQRVHTVIRSHPPISIHALRVEGDGIYSITINRDWRFLSTPSGWRATYTSRIEPDEPPNFYPRPPGGGRLCLQR